ncbi:hypothetical protein SLEP1_g43325 [Rubroshorea leprosula]|uniref:Uncharacterized protein n=1 Tax=Rubroshorea leprosula TaxID=152421 RepID=A0AAV5LDD2_9ROSI|nr:hypothetical protein SLEP1_g43325 [Rubroshorea leprosula]
MEPDLSIGDEGAVHARPWQVGKISISFQLRTTLQITSAPLQIMSWMIRGRNEFISQIVTEKAKIEEAQRQQIQKAQRWLRS